MIIPFCEERRGQKAITNRLRRLPHSGRGFLRGIGSATVRYQGTQQEMFYARCILEKNGSWEVTLR